MLSPDLYRKFDSMTYSVLFRDVFRIKFRRSSSSLEERFYIEKYRLSCDNNLIISKVI